jgi:dihydrofolate reductase
MKVVLLAAVSLDMYISPADQETLPSTLWTSQEDKAFFTKKSKELKVMVMGSKTFATIGRVLPERKTVVLTSRPEELTAEFLQKQQLAALPKDLEFTAAEPEELIAELTRQGYQELALCGGATIYNLFLQKNLVDQLYLTVEPVSFGKGVALFQAEKSELKRWQLRSSQQLNETGTLLLEYHSLHV